MWANLLDAVRYLIVWNPVIVGITQVTTPAPQTKSPTPQPELGGLRFVYLRAVSFNVAVTEGRAV